MIDALNLEFAKVDTSNYNLSIYVCFRILLIIIACCIIATTDICKIIIIIIYMLQSFASNGRFDVKTDAIVGQCKLWSIRGIRRNPELIKARAMEALLQTWRARSCVMIINGRILFALTASMFLVCIKYDVVRAPTVYWPALLWRDILIYLR